MLSLLGFTRRHFRTKFCPSTVRKCRRVIFSIVCPVFCYWIIINSEREEDGEDGDRTLIDSLQVAFVHEEGSTISVLRTQRYWSANALVTLNKHGCNRSCEKYQKRREEAFSILRVLSSLQFELWSRMLRSPIFGRHVLRLDSKEEEELISMLWACKNGK